jgi:hypothetical protein
MNTQQQQDLLSMIKILGDENRLRLISRLSEEEQSVSAIASWLKLADSTTSYHLSKLHSVGLLRLRMEGNHRYYSVNQKRLDTLKAYIHEIDQPIIDPEAPVIDQSWIDALDWSAEEKKVLRDYTQNRVLLQIPTKDKKWIVILKWLATHFAPNTRYTEKEVNAILTPIHADYATLRRDLIGFGFMRRERGGGDYWLTPENEVAFTPEAL